MTVHPTDWPLSDFSWAAGGWGVGGGGGRLSAPGALLYGTAREDAPGVWWPAGPPRACVCVRVAIPPLRPPRPRLTCCVWGTGSHAGGRVLVVWSPRRRKEGHVPCPPWSALRCSVHAKNTFSSCRAWSGFVGNVTFRRDTVQAVPWISTLQCCEPSEIFLPR